MGVGLGFTGFSDFLYDFSFCGFAMVHEFIVAVRVFHGEMGGTFILDLAGVVGGEDMPPPSEVVYCRCCLVTDLFLQGFYLFLQLAEE